jgi:aminopeptidase N
MVGAFTPWKQYDTKRQSLMQEQVQRILKAEGLSSNVFEIASKTLH